MADSERDVLFANEAFVIGMLQAVSGGGLIAAISETDAIVSLAGKIGFLLFLSAMALTLVVAVLAAYWKHNYKMWDVKGQASTSQEKMEEALCRSALANRYLYAMRTALVIAVIGVIAGVGALVASFWLHALCAT